MSLAYGTYSSMVGPLDLVDATNDPGPAPALPEKEYVGVFGGRTLISEVPFGDFGHLFRRQPLHVLRVMQLVPIISSSLNAIKAGTLSGGFVVTPAVRDKAPKEDDADAAEAQRAVEECLASAFRMEQPLEVSAWELMDGMAEGHKLAEVVYEAIESGPYAGSYGLKAIKAKPRWSYRFAVDKAMNVVGVDCYTVDGEWARLDPDKFAWLTWDGKDGDPRGHSALDGVYHAFTMLMSLWPEFLKGNKKFGTPSKFGTTSPMSARMVPPRDKNGQEIVGGKPVPAEYGMARSLDAMENGASIAGPPGADVKILESQRDGVGMNNAIAICEAQVARSLLLQVRATMESKHGSKADSETGQDVLGTLLRYVRTLVCQPIRCVFHHLLEVNHGEEYADRFTPHVGLGRIEPQDFVAFATAIAVLFQSGYFTEDQIPEMDALMNLPQRRAGQPRVGPQKDAAASPDASPPTPDQVNKAIATIEAFAHKYDGRAG